MPRLFLSDDRVRRLVSRLVPLYAGAGSINHLCTLLNRALGADDDQKEIYPNRLRTLFSEEPTRSLNESSVTAIEQAVTVLTRDGLLAGGEQELRPLFDRVRAAWPNSKDDPEPVADVARCAKVPPAVAAAALRHLGLDATISLRAVDMGAQMAGEHGSNITRSGSRRMDTTTASQIETTVVNLREEFDIKITRNCKGQVPPPPEFGCFGNPYKVEEHGREECIRLFKDYFLKRVEEDKEFREAAMKLQGRRLGCFCKPLACHGDVIKEWLDAQPLNPLNKQVQTITRWVGHYFGLNECAEEFKRRLMFYLEVGEDPQEV